MPQACLLPASTTAHHDAQVVDEKMLVFINDLLSSGEIPDLFPAEDKDEIINAMRSETKAAGLIDTNDNCWATFINKVKENLHMVFTASPVGDNFRIRSQRFLATINSTVIDWFQPWPEASLLSVAERFLKDVDLGSDTVRRFDSCLPPVPAHVGAPDLSPRE